MELNDLKEIMDLKALVNENQSIKIVPSIEDIVRKYGFNTDLDDNTVLHFNQIKLTWQVWKKSAPVKSSLCEIFSTASDPFSVALKMVVKCDDFKDCKPKTLPYCIVEELDAWNQTYNINPDGSLKFTAFQMATQQRNQEFLNLIVKTFNVKTEKTAVLPLVQDMLKQGVYKQALQSVMSMEMYDCVPVEDLLFPLVLQDKGSMIDTYLIQCPHQAKPLILYIDSYLDRSSSLKDKIQNFVTEHDVVDVKWDKLYRKPMGKLVARMCTKFKIPLQECRNLSKNRTTGGLRYLIGQKYQEKNVSETAWYDLVKDSLEQNPEATFDFIDMLIEYDVKEAKKWAEYFKLPVEKYPSTLLEPYSNVMQDTTAEENWESEPGTSQQYYSLSLDREKIKLVDNELDFYSVIEGPLKHVNFVGIDCEWKPSFGASQSKVALIQIATAENVFLIDCTVMNTKNYTNVWQNFLSKVIDNAEIVKIGFGLEHDIREMKNTFVDIGNLKMTGEGFLDLSKLWKCLMKFGVNLPHEKEGAGNSLSSLTEACFGFPLTKHEQCSNWEVRPLRPNQIEYAALDAYVLIEIYSFLQQLCKSQNINFDDICCNVMEEGKQKVIVKKSKLTKKKDILTQTLPERCVKMIRFLVECNLYELVKHLRFCGIDCTLIPSDMLWHNVVNFAISEDRCILLSKMKNTPTVNYPQSNIHQVAQSDTKQQLLSVLKHFQVKVTPENLFQRCVLCNSINLSTMTSKRVREMYTEYNESKRTSRLDTECDTYDEMNDFLSDYDSDSELYQPVQPVIRTSKEFLTKYGASLHIDEVSNLPKDFEDTVMVCEDCGKFYWNGFHPIKDAGNLINDLPLC